MKRAVRLSSVQPRYIQHKEVSIEEGIAENTRNILAHLHEAGRRRSDIVLLPEICTHAGLTIPSASLEQFAERLDNPFFKEVSAVCRQYNMHVAVSVHLKLDENIYNSCVFLDRTGSVAGIYHKVHLTYPEMELGVRPGCEFPVFRLDFGTVGAMICHDNSFVESARCLAVQGAEIIFWPHMQSGWGENMWDVQLRARAIDNGCIVASSSYSHKSDQGHWQPGRIVGRSGIVNDDGIILADIGRAEGIATAEVDLDDHRRAHSFCYAGVVDYRQTMLSFRNPAAYGPLVSSLPDKK